MVEDLCKCLFPLCIAYAHGVVQEVNVLGLHNTVSNWIRSQPDPKSPVGTVINVNSGLEGIIMPGMSAYSTAKLAAHRYMEYLDTGV